MKREDIIRMAKKADLVNWLPNSTFSDGIWWIEAHEVGSELERFAALVASAEREACIDLVAMYGGPVDLEAAIRARGQA